MGYLNQLYNGLIIGLVFGDESGWSSFWNHQFDLIGMSYLFKVSGYNLYFVANSTKHSLQHFFNKRLTVLVTIFVTFIYYQMCIPNYALTRALCFQFYQLLAKDYLQRQSHSLFIFIIVTLVFVIGRWERLTEASFQISFLAAAVVRVFWPPLKIIFRKGLTKITTNKLVNNFFYSLLQPVLLSICIQVFCGPVFVYYFSGLNLTSIVAGCILSFLTVMLIKWGVVFYVLKILTRNSLFFSLVNPILVFFSFFLSILAKIYLTSLRFFVKFNFLNFDLEIRHFCPILIYYTLLLIVWKRLVCYENKYY